VTIQSAANDVTAPLVSHKIGPRVEVDDTIIVRATDASAIAWIGIPGRYRRRGHIVEIRYSQRGRRNSPTSRGVRA